MHIDLSNTVYRHNRNWSVLGNWKESRHRRSGIDADIVRYCGCDCLHYNAISWRDGGFHSGGWIILHFRWVSFLVSIVST
jgi:hypothetical protein